MTAPWWHTADPTTSTLLDLAYQLDGDALNGALTLLGVADQAPAMHTVAADLLWVEKLRADYPADALSAFYGTRWRGINADATAELVADDLQADVLVRVAGVAERIGLGMAA